MQQTTRETSIRHDNHSVHNYCSIFSYYFLDLDFNIQYLFHSLDLVLFSFSFLFLEICNCAMFEIYLILQIYNTLETKTLHNNLEIVTRFWLSLKLYSSAFFSMIFGLLSLYFSLRNHRNILIKMCVCPVHANIHCASNDGGSASQLHGKSFIIVAAFKNFIHCD